MKCTSTAGIEPLHTCEKGIAVRAKDSCNHLVMTLGLCRCRVKTEGEERLKGVLTIKFVFSFFPFTCSMLLTDCAPCHYCKYIATNVFMLYMYSVHALLPHNLNVVL